MALNKNILIVPVILLEAILLKRALSRFVILAQAGIVSRLMRVSTIYSIANVFV